jgi:hypothetical protein
MEENKPGQQPETSGAESTEEQTTPQEDISLSDAITGVITDPSGTFEAVKASSKKNYWIIPILIFIVLYVASSFLVLNDEDLYTEIKTKQTTAVKERLDNAVKDGKMSREKANEQLETIDKQMSKSNPIFYVFAAVGPIFTTFIILFLEGLVFFGVLKIFKGTATYMNILSVLGLAAIIECIQVIIDTVLAIVMGKLNSNIGPSLLFKADSVGENMFKFIVHFDVITIWLLIVAGIGLAKVSQLKTSLTMPVVFVLWLIWISLTSFLKLGFFGM